MLLVSLCAKPGLKSRSLVLLDYARQRLQQQGVEVISYRAAILRPKIFNMHPSIAHISIC